MKSFWPIDSRFRGNDILLLLILVASWAEARSNAAIRAFNEAVQHFNAKEFREAIPLFDEALYNDSEFAEAYFARGACRYYLQSPEGALMDLNDALRRNPDYLAARGLRGSVYYEEDHWDEALQDFNFVLSKNPREVQSLLGRAVILMKREDWAGAQRDFKEFLVIRPEDPLAPKIRQLLASFKSRGKDRSVEEAAPESPSPARTAARPPPAETSRSPSSAELQRMAEEILANPMRESYGRKVLRGERAEAVGNIRQNSGNNVEIAEPR